MRTLLKEIEEDDDEKLIVVATIQSKEFNDSSFKKYSGKQMIAF